MKMRKYTQEEIDDILNNFDVENEEHKFKLQDIALIWNIDAIASTTKRAYAIDADKVREKIRELLDYILNVETPDELPQDEVYTRAGGKSSYKKLKATLDLIDFIREENKLQGIATGDFERNIWRLAYVFKSTQFAEELAIQGKEVARPIDLVENFQDDDINNFNSTYARLTIHYENTQSLIGFLRLLLDKTEVKDIQRFIDKLELDLDLVDILETEANLTEGYILDYLKRNVKAEELSAPTREELEEKTNKLIDDLLEKYKPLLHVPNLKRMKLTDEAYLKIRNRYKDLTVKELLERKVRIQNDFRDVLYDEHGK